MHRFSRPPRPADFDQTVAERRAIIEALFKAGKLSSAAKRKKKKKGGGPKPAAARKPKEADPFCPMWGEFKPLFSAAQHRKCAFCEGDAAVQQFGDVEHFRPKSEIRHLQNEGKERQDSPKVKGRNGLLVGITGYWWLAYDWDNYILACEICNRQWKANFFPIVEEPRAKDAPKFGVAETPLLLHPFEGPMPRDHLEYNDLGQVIPRTGSAHGVATIRTLGLNRIGLMEQRRDIAAAVIDNLEEIRQKRLSPDAIERMLKEIYRLGREHAPFCGMVRTIVHQRGGPEVTWDQIERSFERTMGR
jgi:hypothetical protein